MSGRDPTAAERGWRGAASPLEWVVAGLSTVLVLGAAGFLLRDAVEAPPTPARITVEVDSVVPAGEGFLVEFRARNEGHTTAAGLTVEGEVQDDSGAVEKSQVTLDYVPARGTRKGGLFFTRDPRRGRLELRPQGYGRP